MAPFEKEKKIKVANSRFHSLEAGLGFEPSVLPIMVSVRPVPLGNVVLSCGLRIG